MAQPEIYPRNFSRRDFLKASGAGAVAFGSARRSLGAEPHLEFPTNPRQRLAVTSYPFRALIDWPGNRARDPNRPAMDLKDFASMVAARFDVHNINPLAAHFRSSEPSYIEELRNAVEKAGSHVVDLGLGGRSFYHPDRAKRDEAVAFGKQGIDIAVALGCPSVRQHISGASGVKADVNLAAESLGELAAYGEKKNVVINLENDSPVTEDPFFLVAVIERAGTPYLRGLPDFANSIRPDGDAERNYTAVAAMFQHAFNMAHVKDAVAGDGKVYAVDLARLFAIAKRSGYRGYFSMESDAPGDPYESTARLVQETLKYL